MFKNLSACHEGYITCLAPGRNRNQCILKYQLKLEGLCTPHPTVKSTKEDAKLVFISSRVPSNFKSYITVTKALKRNPYFKAIKTKTVEYMEIPPDRTTTYDKLSAAW